MSCPVLFDERGFTSSVRGPLSRSMPGGPDSQGFAKPLATQQPTVSLSRVLRKALYVA